MAVKQLQNLEYEWLGQRYSLRPFVQQFSEFIKQKDQKLEDAERIAEDYLDAVSKIPEDFIAQLKPENMSHARYFVLPDGSVFSKENPLYDSPEFTTQRGLYSIYEHVLGVEKFSEYLRLVNPNKERSDEEDARFKEMEKTVSASNYTQMRLETPASKVNAERNAAAVDLAEFLKRNNDIAPIEKALLLKGIISWGAVEKRTSTGIDVNVVSITDSNDLQPIKLDGEKTVKLAQAYREGKKVKDGIRDIAFSKVERLPRSVEANYTGWKIYKQSRSIEDAAILNQDVKGTGWCTGGSVSTAQMHLSGGDFHVYFEAGEPLIAIRTNNGRMAEPPRGAHKGQFCTDREEQIAFEYITNGNAISAGENYVQDILDIRRIMRPDATWKDAWDFPERRRYNNGEFGGDLKAWGEGVNKKIHGLLFSEPYLSERHKLGYYIASERTPYKDKFKRARFTGIVNLASVRYLKGDIAIGKVEYVRKDKTSLHMDIIPVTEGRVYAPNMESLKGGFFAYYGSFTAPSLKRVEKFASVLKDCDVRTDALESVGDYVSVREGAQWNPRSLKDIKEGLFVHHGASAHFDSLERVGDKIEVRYASRIFADNLLSAASLRIFSGAFMSATQLETVSKTRKIDSDPNIFIVPGGFLKAPKLGYENKKDRNSMKTLKEILGADRTEAYGVEFSPTPAALRTMYKDWLKHNKGGIVAYRVFGDKSFTPGTVKQGIIGNPFNWTENSLGEAEATKRFYQWLHTGENFGEPNATDEFRNAIIDRLRQAPDNAHILYYREIGSPSHATVLGYFVQHKDQLFDYGPSLAGQTERTVSQETPLRESPAQTLPQGDILSFAGPTRFLSNFWPAPVLYEGVIYPCAENAYQAAKCKNPDERVLFVDIPPAEAKRLGSEVQLRDDWDAVKDGIMKIIVKDKFSRTQELSERLLATGEVRLSEGNRWGDTYWGVDLTTGEGENRLGEILMEVREEIRLGQINGNYLNNFNMEPQELNTQQTEQRPIGGVSPNELSNARELSTYSAFQLNKILNEIMFPPVGENAVFDKAAKDIDEALSPGWTKDMDERQIRAYLLGVIANLPAEVQDYITVNAESVKLAKTIFDESPCDVYTLGFSTKSLDDFTAALPPHTRIIVDIRNWPYNKFQSQFNKNVLPEALSSSGIKVVHISEESATFMDDLRSLINRHPGQVVIASSESQASKSTRGQLVGPGLELNGITVGHISQAWDAETKTWKRQAVVTTQEELTENMLSKRGLRIANGSFKNVTFNTDGSVKESHGVVLKPKERKEQVNRNIAGNWNYGASVKINETEKKGLESAVSEVDSKADFTFVITKNKRMHTADDKRNIDAASRGIDVHFPEEFAKMRHELSDAVAAGIITKDKMDSELTSYVRHSIGAEKLVDRIGRYILAARTADPEHIDPMHLTVGFVGANIARLRTRAVQAKVSSEELSGEDIQTFFSEMGGYEGGNSIIVESVNIDQEDVNDFCYKLLQIINEPRAANEFDDDATARNFNVSKVIAIGETGAGLGGAIAAQRLYQEHKLESLPEFQLLNKGEHTEDNETLQGRKIYDTASIVNYLHQGHQNAPTVDELRLQIDHVRELGEHPGTPGLTDRNVLALSQLGFSNKDILIMHEQSVINKVTFNGHPKMSESGQQYTTYSDDLMELIQMCGGYGVEAPSNLSIEHIMQAELDVEKMLVNERRNGIGVMTIANPLYPDRFRTFEGYTDITEDTNYVVNDGVASVSVTREEVREERPAILRFKGNIDALSQSMVAVTGNTTSSEEAKHAAANIGRALAESDIAIVTPFRLTENIRHNVKIQGSKTVTGKVWDEELDREAVKLTVARRDSATAARDAAIASGATPIIISPNSLTHQPDEDQINKVISSGGIILSEAGFESGEGSERAFRRAGHLSCALGGTAILIDGKAEDTRNSPTDELKSAKDGYAVVQYNGTKGIDGKIAGNEVLLEEGAIGIDMTGKNIDTIIGKAQFVSTSDALQEFMQQEAREKEASYKKPEEMHVGKYRFHVVRRGTEQVFIVPENYPDVRDAVRLAYGKDVKFADNQSITRRNMQEMTREINGEQVKTFTGYVGTQIMNEPVYTVPLFYQKGEIYSISNAPARTEGLLPLKRRIENKALMDEVRQSALEIQRRMNSLLGLPENASVRMENALYPVITPYSVEVYRGSELRAKVSLQPSGALLVSSFGLQDSDLYNEFYSPDPYNTLDAEKKDELDRLNNNRPKDDTFFNDKLIRSQLNDLANTHKVDTIRTLVIDRLEENLIGKGALKLNGIESKNLDLAEKDIEAGISAGLLSSHGENEYDRRTAVAAVTVQEAEASRDMLRLQKEASKIDTEIDALTEKRDKAYNESTAPEELKEMDDRIETLLSDQTSAKSGLRELLERKGVLQDLKERIVLAEKVSLIKTEGEGKAQKVAICIDGLAANIFPGKIRDNAPWDVVDKAIASIKEMAANRTKDFNESVERIENHEANLKTIGQIMDRRRKEGHYGVAQKSEIVQDSFSNGRYIIERDGKKAYADEALNIRSDFYKDLKKWQGRNGFATQNDGKHNFIDIEGRPIIEKWFDSFTKASENVFVIVVDSKYGVVGEEGKLLGGRLFDNARESHDGWSIVKDFTDGEHKGKFNYINASGRFLSDTWFDDAGDFKNGKAEVVLDGKHCIVTKEGMVFDGLDQGNGNKPGNKNGIH